MEPEQPPSEELNPPATTTTDQQPQPQQNASHTTVRSYECHFCKRGFTNAQALGGHMNIHRKDKTKLNKHPSSSTTTTTTSPKPLVESPSTTTAANPFSISHQGNWRFSDTPQDDKKPLPLFDHHDHTTVPRNIIHQPENPPLPEGDVDLELRLGHGTEPQPESSSENKTATTRKFF